jgi:excisionase family DNA binding protein
MGEKLLSVPECALRKGVSRTTIYRAVANGSIPSVKVGRAYAIAEGACDAFELTPPQEKGRRAMRTRWVGHEKPAEDKPKRPRGRPRKQTEKAGSEEEETK